MHARTLVTTALCLCAATAALVGDTLLRQRCCGPTSAVPAPAGRDGPDAARMRPVRLAAPDGDDATLLAPSAASVMCLRSAFGSRGAVLQASGGGAFGPVDDYAGGGPASVDGTSGTATAGAVDPDAGDGRPGGARGMGGLFSGFSSFSGLSSAGAPGLGGSGYGAGGEPGAGMPGGGATGIRPAVLGAASQDGAGAASDAAGGPAGGADGASPLGGVGAIDPAVLADGTGPDARMPAPDITRLQPDGALPDDRLQAVAGPAGAAIVAGNVPEPGSLALALLGLGAAGLAAWRGFPWRLLSKR